MDEHGQGFRTPGGVDPHARAPLGRSRIAFGQSPLHAAFHLRDLLPRPSSIAAGCRYQGVRQCPSTTNSSKACIMSVSAVSAAAPAAVSSVPAQARTKPAQGQAAAASKTQAASQSSSSAAAAEIAAASAALKEATETSAQTAKEAAGGDHQAQRLLAKETAQRGAPAAPSRASARGSRINEKA
jgi:hypothetical protein